MTSARVGSAIVAGCGAEAVDEVGDGGGLGLEAAAVGGWVEQVGEDRRDLESDTRLSRALNP